MSDEDYDPNVSAVVTVKSGETGPPDIGRMGFIKQKFSGLGFEVHAPFTTNFSIGGRKSLFERIFGVTLKVDEDSLAAGVTTDSGGLDLPVDPLPDEIQVDVASVAFMPPMAFPMSASPPK